MSHSPIPFIRRGPRGTTWPAVLAIGASFLLATPALAAPGGTPGKPAKADPAAAKANSSTTVTSPTTTATSAATSRGGQKPPGNNGHILIDKYDMDGGGNEPHVACGFSVSFFGYDAGSQQASITLTPHAPTRGGTPFTLSATWQTAQRTSGNQLNANVKVPAEKIAAVFSGVAPHKQGYHAKIDVHVTGSQGADAKHKVIWIKPCAAASATGATTSTLKATTTTTTTPGTTSSTAASATAASGASGNGKVGSAGGSAGGAVSAGSASHDPTQASPATAVMGGATFTG